MEVLNKDTIEIGGAFYKKVIDIVNPETPLPYKGMNTRTEIARTIMPSIIQHYDIHSKHDMDSDTVIELIAIDTLRYTDALINQLNKK